MASYTHGRFVWRELMTENPDAAKRYYGELFGWSVKDVPMGDMTYHLLHAGEKQVGGLVKKPPMMPVSAWASYVSVPDVDATCAVIASAGGKVVHGPSDIPNMGRFAFALDPQGAAFALWKGEKGDQPVARPGLGEFCWESLGTTDEPAALAFYTKVLGWKQGKMGEQNIFGTAEGMENQVASVMAAPPGVPAHWLTYVAVEKLAAARDRASKLGGKILMPEIEVPTIGKFAVTQDPQGATICMFESAMG